MASFEVVNNVGLIICQNPPVNALSYHLRKGLLDGLEKGLSDPSVEAIVIICDGQTFIAGADISEFGNGMAFKKPSIQDFIAKLELSPKPVIAAIHGTALGGGFEVALACHYRIGTNRCKVGLPEVLIGLLPGAGGTQRLPRLIGPLLAAEMICTGVHIKSQVAKQRGILDEVVYVEKNHRLDMERLILRNHAIKFALKVSKLSLNNRILSKRPCNKLDDFFYQQISAMSNKRARGFLAPKLCLEAVKACQRNSSNFEQGLKEERKLFLKLATDSQSRCLQHIFFSQRQITKIPELNGLKVSDVSLPIKKVGIIGCGTMGGGIAMNFMKVNIPVVILDMKQEYLDRGLNVIKSNFMRQVKKGKLSKNKFEKYMSLLTPTLNYNDLNKCDIVIEAVFENLDIKKKVFKKLDEVCKKECILASNTSFLPIEEIAKVTSRPNQVIGTHFFAPANKMLLLENVRHDKNDNVTIATVQNLAKIIKKKGVLVRSCPGFVGNRMYRIQGSEAYRLILEGSLPQEIDKILYDFGMAMGIFQVSDLSGLDIGYRARDDYGYIQNQESFPNGGKDYYMYDVPDILVKKYARLGLKAGKGIYDYPNPKTRKPVPSKLVTNLIYEISKKKGIQRRNISKDEVLERLFYPMINEGIKILEEKVAIRPSDIDVVFCFGYGFPAFRGGIMNYGDLIGMKKIRNKLLEFYNNNKNVPYFKPADLLNYLADNNMSLNKYWRKKSKQSKL